jgi:small-conductance mechanosensitive channel
MAERRVPFTIGVTYQTPPEKLRKVPDMFKKLLEQFDDVHFDRAHFKSYGSYSLNFEFVYYVHTPDYNRYMDIQQALNLGLYDGFAAEGIEFAYPTQTLYMDRAGGREKPAENQQDRLAE